MSGEQLQAEQVSYEIALKLRDLEENQKIMKERMLLIGKNLIDFQEDGSSEIIEIKKQVQDMQSDLKRIKQVLESVSEEISKSARKEEVAILSRQIKMFEPLKYARIEDVHKIVKDRKSNEEEINNSGKHKFWESKI